MLRYVYGARSTASKTRRCGECEGCNREDCGDCEACKDKPRFGGKGTKKQACTWRLCTWKNPSGTKRGRGRGRGAGTGHGRAASEGTPVSMRTALKQQEAAATTSSKKASPKVC